MLISSSLNHGDKIVRCLSKHYMLLKIKMQIIAFEKQTTVKIKFNIVGIHNFKQI